MSSPKEEIVGSMNSEGETASESRFTDLCKALKVSEEVISEATSLLNEIKSILLSSSFGGKGPEEMEIYCHAFVLYCAIKLKDDLLKEEDKQGRIRLSDILRATSLKLDDFFKEAQQFTIKAKQIMGDRYGFDWEDRLELKQLEKIVRMLNDARKFFDKTFGDFFSFGLISQGSNTSEISKEIHRFGWLLFLTLRIDTPDLFKDLVSCVHGLVAVLAILILHVPVKFRNFSPQDTSRLVKRSEKGVDLLASLCNTYHTFEDCLRGMMEKAYKIISETLNRKPIPASDCKTDLMNYINTEGLMYFNNMLEEGLVGPGIQALEKHYMDVVGSKGEIDEMLFMQPEDKSSVGASNLCDNKSKYETLASPKKTITNMLTLPLSPMSPARPNFIISNPKILQMTPVTTAMTTAKWLREVISPLPDRPSPHLEQFLSLPDNKILTNDLMRRAHIVLEAIFHNGNSFDISWAKERKFEASKLYYRVLESICKSESNLLSSRNEKNNNGSGNNLAQLLSNERFHRCMLACSAELVLATHKTVLMMFPAVLESTGLTPFDLSKVIESFVRHEETLPRELKRHLNSLEEQLLESMVWAKGSSLYNSLLVAQPDLGPEISRLSLLAEPMLSLDEIAARHNIPVSGDLPVSNRKRDISPDQEETEAPSPKRACIESGSVLLERNCFTPPAKERLYSLKSKFHPLQSSFASPAQPNPVGGNETCAEIGCKVFFSKILKLGAIRIRSLCERLRQPQQILDRVYGLFQQIIDKQTHLFFNRHVDQIILCCFYGVAKVSRLNLTFKEIVSSYKKEPQCKPEVFRNVFVGSSNMRIGICHVDIITFYNEVFVPAVKPLLVGMVPSSSRSEEKTAAEGGTVPGSPKVSPFSNLPDMSPKKVSASHNVYVSPLRQSKMDALLSPSSRSYYACIGESTHAFQSPSKDLDAINSRLNSTGRRLPTGRINFDMVSDSVVAGSLGYQNGSSASSDGVAAFGLPVKREPAETD
ncbi:hypothetical protein LUZ63_016997 [Rhynchospora breviuscula]|uniref:Retinoblastoma-related protein n=1 Tax=Rhynchospora breviuscula TaxID=2022672 RepID=A0A9Q0C1N0_9POAL|nr:hypothetical protein LUZ63_016997 [Rhynchospora breviuscula]